MKDRIRKLRKALDLTQREFAERIGMKPNTIATYEMGRAFPSDPSINNICKEFDVNEEWLRTGEGKMFAPKASNALDALAKERGLSREAYIVIEKFLNLKPELQEGIISYVLDVADDINGAAAWQARNGQKKSAAARSGDRAEAAQVSPEEEEAALPPDYSGDI